MASSEKSEFENVSGGWIGVQVHDDARRAGFKGIGLKPEGRIWLDEEEQVATANRPRKAEDNPFINGHLKLTASKQEMQNRRPIGDSLEPQAPAPEPAPDEPQADGAPEGEESKEGTPGDGEQPPEKTEPAQKSEDEMTEAEKAAHNRAAAAARAVPSKQPPPSPPPTTTAASEKKAPTPPEQVGTPEAVAAAGKKPEGKRDSTEHVGTPGAQGQ
jgi:hypothetical protein